MNISQFGLMPDGKVITAYELGAGDLRLTVINYGAIIQKLTWHGTDFVCGFDTLEGYLVSSGCQGALVGRVANRIEGGKFTLNGKEYTLACNETDKNNHLHGGKEGFAKKVWNAQPVICDGKESLVLTLHSPDGEEGYPGNLDVTVTYTVTNDTFSIHYGAVSDADTVVNLTNHAYFNMNGIAGGPIYDQTLWVGADEISVINEYLIPKGHASLDGSIFDFRTPKLLSKELMEADEEQMRIPSGLDHNYILSKKETIDLDGSTLAKAAEMKGRCGTLTLYTDAPCVQFYAANFMNGPYPLKGGLKQQIRHGLCLETQEEPNSVNHGGCILRKGEAYAYTALFCLS